MLLLDQRVELRRLLALGLVQSFDIEEGRPSAGQALQSLLSRTLDWFERCGPGAGGQDGRRWRREVEALCSSAGKRSDLELAARFDRLARGLLADIAREDRRRVRKSCMQAAEAPSLL